MLNFSNVPPTDPRGTALPLVRTPAFKPLVATITSTDLVGCPTHFYHGRTVPHDDEDCAPCNAGMPWRWHAWLSAVVLSTNTHILFECTRQAAETLLLYRTAHNTLRGCTFRAQRPSKQPNGRVYIETKKADLDKLTLPEAPDLIKCLAIIWNIATDDMAIPDERRGMPHVAVERNPLHKPETAPGNGRLQGLKILDQ